MAWHQDMPFGEMTYYAQWRVMRAAKDAGVKVLLDGQGGDEVFGGYAKFRYAYLASLLRSGRWIGLAKEFGATVLQGDRYVLNIRNGYRYLPRQLRRVLGVDSLLRKALQGIIPDVVRQRKSKLGFAVPSRQWLTRELRPQVSALIEDSLKSAKYVDPEVLRRWYRASPNGAQRAEAYLGLFRLLSLEMWMRAFSIS